MTNDDISRIRNLLSHESQNVRAQGLALARSFEDWTPVIEGCVIENSRLGLSFGGLNPEIINLLCEAPRFTSTATDSLDLSDFLNTTNGVRGLTDVLPTTLGLTHTSLWISFTSGCEYFDHELDNDLNSGATFDGLSDRLTSESCEALFNELRAHPVMGGRVATEEALKRLAEFYGAFLETYGIWEEWATEDETWRDLGVSESASEVMTYDRLAGPDGQSMPAVTLHGADFNDKAFGSPSKKRFAPSASGTMRFRIDFSRALSGHLVYRLLDMLDERVGTPSFEWSTDYRCSVAGSDGGNGFWPIGIKYHKGNEN